MCRVSSVGSFIGFFVTAALSIGLFAFDRWMVEAKNDVPSFVVTYMAIVIGLIALLFLFNFKKSLRSSNWLVQLGATRVLIKYRSYLNDHLPEEDSVIAEIPWSEIVWVRKTKENVVKVTSTASDDGPTHQYFTYLDLKLNSTEAETLRRNLLDERNRRPPIRKMNRALFEARKRRAPQSEIDLLQAEIRREEKMRPKGGSRFSTVIHHHYPVRMTDALVLRLDWSGIRPRIGHILKLLENKIPVEPPVEFTTDFTETFGNAEDRILDLAARGETMYAVILAREHYGYSIAEAKTFVESLLEKQS